MLAVTRTLLALGLLLLAAPASAQIYIVGSVTYETLGGTVRLTADAVENQRLSGISGTLRLELWAHETSVPGLFYRLGYTTLGELPAGFGFYDIDATVAYTPPPAGTWYVSMVVTEYDGDFNTYTDIVTFPNFLVIGGGAGGIDLSGTVAYTIDGGFVRLEAGAIENFRANGVSGTLRLELWAHTSPTPTTFYRLGYATLGTLAAGFGFYDVDQTVPFAPPPPGTYYLSLVVTEYDGFDYNTYVDLHTFSGLESFGGGGGGGSPGACFMGRRLSGEDKFKSRGVKLVSAPSLVLDLCSGAFALDGLGVQSLVGTYARKGKKTYLLTLDAASRSALLAHLEQQLGQLYDFRKTPSLKVKVNEGKGLVKLLLKAKLQNAAGKASYKLKAD